MKIDFRQRHGLVSTLALMAALAVVAAGCGSDDGADEDRHGFFV